MDFNCPPVTTLPNCSIPVSYDRQDKGLAITPWIFTFGMLMAHVVSLIIRVFARFESSQLLSIILAVYSIAITVSAFHSTGFAPEQVYAWTPIGLGLDVAGMLHLI